jgi:hypothetical protein
MRTLGSLIKWFVIAQVAGVNYYDYLDSDAWKFRRRVRCWLDHNRCQNHKLNRGFWGRFFGSTTYPRCDSTRHLTCHHKTYKRLGWESILFDLITVCWDDHKAHHNRERAARNERRTTTGIKVGG